MAAFGSGCVISTAVQDALAFLCTLWAPMCLVWVFYTMTTSLPPSFQKRSMVWKHSPTCFCEMLS